MSDQAEQLQQTFVDQLKSRGLIKTAPVEAAFRAIPRHLFVTNVTPAEVYQDVPIGTNKKDGQVVSSSSAPGLMAQMLEYLQLKPGLKVLEIGAGTGFNAALMAHIVGQTGKVVTIDLDQDVVDDATEHLLGLGLGEIVEVLCRDGALGDQANAPFDRIILTVGAADIAPAWIDQLKAGGLFIIPLELTELESVMENQPLIVFKKIGDHLASQFIQRCGFMRLRGSLSTKPQGLHQLADILDLSIITPVKIDESALTQALTQDSFDQRTGILVKYADLFGLHLYFGLRLPNYCYLYATANARKLARFFTRDGRSYTTVGLCSTNSLSVLSLEQELTNNSVSSQLIIRTFGPDQSLTKEAQRQLLEWERRKRPFVFQNDQMKGIKIKAYPKNISLQPSQKKAVVEKRSANLLISWN